MLSGLESIFFMGNYIAKSLFVNGVNNHCSGIFLPYLLM